MKLSIVPPSTNPSNKFNRRIVGQVLPDQLEASNIQYHVGRIFFEKDLENVNVQEWSEILSPASLKSLRLIVAKAPLLPSFSEREVIDKLVDSFPSSLPWHVYERFGNAVASTKTTNSLLNISCRRWANCCIPKSSCSTTSLTQLLRKALMEQWGKSDAKAQTTDCEFTLLLMDATAVLEWTLLVPPCKAATMDLPRPGCKRVEAWMLVQSFRDIVEKHQQQQRQHHDDSKLVIMDPLCGKATYLVEAASTLPPSANIQYIGVDMSPDQLADAAVNVQAIQQASPQHLSSEMFTFTLGDSRFLEWQTDESVDLIVSCPPFGRQFGREYLDSLPTLYDEWVREWTRVLKQRMVLLVDVAHEDVALQAIANNQHLSLIVHREPFRLGRLQATVIVADKNIRGKGTPLRRLPWEGHVKESRAEWSRLRASSLQMLVPYSN